MPKTNCGIYLLDASGWYHHRSINQGRRHREVNSCLPPCDVFCLDVLGPIVSPDHAFIQEMMNLPAPFANGEYSAFPLGSRHVQSKKRGWSTSLPLSAPECNCTRQPPQRSLAAPACSTRPPQHPAAHTHRTRSPPHSLSAPECSSTRSQHPPAAAAHACSIRMPHPLAAAHACSNWPTMSYPNLRYRILLDVVSWYKMSYSNIRCRILAYDVVYWQTMMDTEILRCRMLHPSIQHTI